MANTKEKKIKRENSIENTSVWLVCQKASHLAFADIQNVQIIFDHPLLSLDFQISLGKI